MPRVYEKRSDVNAICANIWRSGIRHWLSTSSSGVETEVIGEADYVVHTVRGLNVVMTDGSICVWLCRQTVAKQVIKLLGA